MVNKLQIKAALTMLDTLEKIKTKQMPIQISYRIARLIPILEKEKQVYFETLRNLIEKYGMRDENDNLKISEDGNSIPIIPEFKEQCYSEMTELEETMIEIDLPLFSISEFNDVDLSIEDIINLNPILSE